MIRLEHVGLTTVDFKPQRLRSQSIAVPILQDISLDLEAEQIVGVVGPTGAGKTCLLKLLNRLVDPSQGHLSFQGTAYGEIPVQQLRQQILLIGAEPKLLDMTVALSLVYGLKLRGQTAEQLQTALGQWQERLQIPADWLAKTASGLSLGQQQWVSITRGIACEPAVLLLDEPTVHLDRDYAQRLRHVLRKLMSRSTQLMVVVSHDWEWLEQLCDRVLYVDGGQLKQDVLAHQLDWTQLRQQITAKTQALEAEWS